MFYKYLGTHLKSEIHPLLVAGMFKFMPGRVCINTGTAAVRMTSHSAGSAVICALSWTSKGKCSVSFQRESLNRSVKSDLFVAVLPQISLAMLGICNCWYQQFDVILITSHASAVLGRASQEKCCTIVQRKGLSRSISVVRWSRVFLIT